MRVLLIPDLLVLHMPVDSWKKNFYPLKTVEKFTAASEEKIFMASRSNEC
jgi:hypothetical protein